MVQETETSTPRSPTTHRQALGAPEKARGRLALAEAEGHTPRARVVVAMVRSGSARRGVAAERADGGEGGVVHGTGPRPSARRQEMISFSSAIAVRRRRTETRGGLSEMVIERDALELRRIAPHGVGDLFGVVHRAHVHERSVLLRVLRAMASKMSGISAKCPCGVDTTRRRFGGGEGAGAPGRCASTTVSLRRFARTRVGPPPLGRRRRARSRGSGRRGRRGTRTRRPRTPRGNASGRDVRKPRIGRGDRPAAQSHKPAPTRARRPPPAACSRASHPPSSSSSAVCERRDGVQRDNDRPRDEEDEEAARKPAAGVRGQQRAHDDAPSIDGLLRRDGIRERRWARGAGSTPARLCAAP